MRNLAASLTVQDPGGHFITFAQPVRSPASLTHNSLGIRLRCRGGAQPALSLRPGFPSVSTSHA